MDRRLSRNIWALTVATGISRFGDHFQFLAVATVTYAMTRSPLATAVQSAIPFLPYVLFARWGGAAADRFNPRVVFGVTHVLRALLALSYLLTDNFLVMFALNFVGATIGVFMGPSRAALLPKLVGREHLLKVNARQSTVTGVAELFGPAIAGWAVLQWGSHWSFIINALSFLAPATAMLLVREVSGDKAAARKNGAAAPKESTWLFLKGRPDLMKLLAAHGIFMFGMWAVNGTYFPYVVEVLGKGTEAVGWAISAYFGASLLVGFVLERWGQHLRSQRLLMGGYVSGSLVWVTYTLVHSVPLMVGLNLLDGTVYTWATTLFTTRVQEEAPDGSVGRITAFMRGIEDFCCIVGILSGGVVATYFGVVTGFRVAAGLCVGLLGLLIIGSAYRRLRIA